LTPYIFAKLRWQQLHSGSTKQMCIKNAQFLTSNSPHETETTLEGNIISVRVRHYFLSVVSHWNMQEQWHKNSDSEMAPIDKQYLY